MCAITSSLTKHKLKDLYRLNAYRGELSYSLSSFKYDGDKVELATLMQDKFKMPEKLVDSLPDRENTFFVAHSQAPTTSSDNIHPAVYGDTLLWHNGIVKQKMIETGTWDTSVLLERIVDYGWSSLSRIDGTFACMMYRSGEMFVFRNEISPMFYDDDFNFSSTKFEFSKPLEPNKVFKLNYARKIMTVESHFSTLENPYYIPEEA
jgi:hypothetical protein